MISPTDIAAVMRYDFRSGLIYWLPRPLCMFSDGRKFSAGHNAKVWNTRYAGKVAGNTTPRGYIQIGAFGRLMKAHRIAWCLHYGSWPSAGIDHINGVKTDNRIINLRDVGQAENNRNAALKRNNTSGACGVSWKRGLDKWTASIEEDGRQVHLGVFTEKTDAIAARKAAERRIGYHENHGRTAPESRKKSRSKSGS